MKYIDMREDTFDELKADMTVSLNRLIRTMREFDSEKAAMTVKVEVTMHKAIGEDGKTIIMPKFTHKVSSTVQAKDEKEGCVAGVYELVATDGGYVLKPIGEQMSMELI